MAKPNMVSKQDLIDSAKKCIVEQGLQKLTLQAVAQGAGVTQGTVYYHFRNKEQLMLAVVQDLCRTSWAAFESIKPSEDLLTNALASAKSRCTADSFYHQLFFSLLVSSFQHDKTREQLGGLLKEENQHLTSYLSKAWKRSPIDGISLEGWAILFNALIDGLAIQALLSPDFSAEQMYAELALLIQHLQPTNSTEQSMKE